MENKLGSCITAPQLLQNFSRAWRASVCSGVEYHGAVFNHPFSSRIFLLACQIAPAIVSISMTRLGASEVQLPPPSLNRISILKPFSVATGVKIGVFAVLPRERIC